MASSQTTQNALPKVLGGTIIDSISTTVGRLGFGECKPLPPKTVSESKQIEFRFECPDDRTISVAVFNDMKVGWHVMAVSLYLGLTPRSVISGKKAEEGIGAFVEEIRKHYKLKCEPWTASNDDLTQQCVSEKQRTANKSWQLSRSRPELLPKSADDV